MRKAAAAMGIIVLLAFSVYNLRRIRQGRRISRESTISVLLVYTSTFTEEYSYVLKAYRSLFEEEGIPFESINAHLLLSLRAEEILQSHPAIIFPDGAARTLPPEMGAWVEAYLQGGGNTMVVYDAGTRNTKSAFLEEAVFSAHTGVNYITFTRLGEKAYATGHIKFRGESSSDFFQVPFGKTAEGLLLGGYAYGRLEYPVARNEPRDDLDPEDVYASAVTPEGEDIPALVIRDYGRGKVLYANLPLGYLKCYSDDFPLRSVLRAFLFQTVKIPHLLNTAYGKGGLVINWHIDTNIDWKSITFMLEEGYLRKDIRYSLHITAGDYRDIEGDGLGFDACGKGRPILELIKDYGRIGSHGGWAHNWFSGNIEHDVFKKSDIFSQIKRNNDCLESIVGYPIREYAAPNGIHPQPDTTQVLDELGFLAYYYTGDTGSAPNRTFFNGEMISDSIIAFPILPFGKSASFYEMKLQGFSEEQVRNWLMMTMQYVIRQRTIRLIYSHPYDVPDYPDAFSSFLDHAQLEQQAGRLRIDTMTQAASFLLRFLKTEYDFQFQKGRLIVSLYNPDGLEGVTAALPKNTCHRPDVAGFMIDEDEDYYYITVTHPTTKVILDTGGRTCTDIGKGESTS